MTLVQEQIHRIAVSIHKTRELLVELAEMVAHSTSVGSRVFARAYIGTCLTLLGGMESTMLELEKTRGDEL